MTTEKSEASITVVKKYGELTHRELFKVRGEHVWQNSPAEAVRCYHKAKAFWAEYHSKRK